MKFDRAFRNLIAFRSDTQKLSIPFRLLVNITRLVLVSLIASGLFICTACNNLSNDDSVTFPPVPPPPAAPKARFAYTADELSATISGFAVDPLSGILTPLAGFPITSGVNPEFLAHDPKNRFLAVADIASNLVRMYAIDSGGGTITEIQPSPYSAGQEPRQLAIDPTGRFMYVASQAANNKVTAFSIGANGVLAPIAGSPFATGGSGSACCVLIHPNGKFAYVADTNNIYAFNIDQSTGVLQLVTSIPGPAQAGGLALDPSGTLLYAVGAGSNSINTFTISSSTGAITASTPSSLELQDGAYTISIHPSGRFAYTVEAGQKLVAYGLQNGMFTSLNSIYSGALGSMQLAIDPSGAFIYAPQTGSSNNVTGFRIDASGTLTALPGSPTMTGQQPMSVTIISQ